VTVKEICNEKEWRYNHTKFAIDGLVFAESWTFVSKREEFELKLCESIKKSTTDSAEPE